MLAKLAPAAMAIVCCLLAARSHAQVDICDRQGGTPDPELQRLFAAQWPKEAERLKNNPENASRDGDRLRLRLEGGGTVELADCPYGNSFHSYAYERYDAAGRFYVVSTSGNEDFSYTLVMRKTGKPFTVFGTPIWASDKSRFLTVACTLQPDRGELTVHVLSGDGLTVEGKVELPCGAESCSARWDHPAWISISCAPRGEETKGKKGTEFVLLRGHDGAWKRFGR